MADKILYKPGETYKYQPDLNPESTPTTPVAGSAQQATTPDADKQQEITTPVSNPYADRAAAQNATTPESGNAPVSPDVAEFVAGKTVPVPVEEPVVDAVAEAPATVQPSDYTFTGKQLEQMGPAVEDAAVADQTQQGKKHLFDWGNPDVSLDSVMKNEGKDKPTRQIIYDYMVWAQENNIPVDYLAINDIVNKSTDISLTPEDDEKARKKTENKERWDKVGNFLLHLGNAIGNVAGGGYGAVKLEDPVQWSERQRHIKDKTLQQQRLNNQSVWSMMQKERADQRSYELRKQQAEALAEYRKNQAEAAVKRATAQDRVAESTIRKNDATTNQINELTPEKKKVQQSIVSRNEKTGNAAITRANKTGSGKSGESTTVRVTDYERDVDGNLRKSTSTTTKRAGSAQASANAGNSRQQSAKTNTQRKKVNY